MSGLVQQGAVNAIGTGVNSPTIGGVAGGNTLICVYSLQTNLTLVAPTDSAGQTWNLAAQATTGGGIQLGLAYLLNANAGTHTLSWATSANPSESNITEWNGITAIGGTPATNTSGGTGVTTLGTGTYTQSQANEVIIAAGTEQGGAGSANPDQMSCTTALFQTLGSSTDFAGNSCIGVFQNGTSGTVYEANAAIVTSISARSATYTWLTTKIAVALIVGFAYTPGGGGAASSPLLLGQALT